MKKFRLDDEKLSVLHHVKNPLPHKIVIAALIIVLNAFQLQATTILSEEKSQVSFVMESVSVKDVLKEIERQSELRFFYNNQQVDVKRIVNVSFQSKPIEDAIKELFAGTSIRYKISGKQIILWNADTQTGSIEKLEDINAIQLQTQIKIVVPITGRVLDEKGEGLPGASIVVKGTTNGMITDANGQFKFENLSPDAILLISSIGYAAQEITIGSQTNIEVKMEIDVTQLAEVMVIGYGTQEKAKVTGSIASVGARDMNLSPNVNPVSGLAGRMAGVVINTRGGDRGANNTSVLIRGVSTTGSNAPLYVVDGIIRDYGGLNFLNANEIESLTVLKDASAAIYGSRAANGVILVTTKRGSSGKPTINLSYNHGFLTPTRLPKMMDGPLFAEKSNLARRVQGLGDIYSPTQIEEINTGSNPLGPLSQNFDWQDAAIADVAHQDKADVSVSGGAEAVKYFVSAGYLKQGSPWTDGYSKNEMYTFRSNIDASINKFLSVTLDLSGRKRTYIIPRYDIAHIYRNFPTYPGLYDVEAVRALDPDLAAQFPGGVPGPGRDNSSGLVMLRDRNFGNTGNDDYTMLSTLGFKWDLPWVTGMSLQGNFAYDYNTTYSKNWQAPAYNYIYTPGATPSPFVKTKLGGAAATPNLDVRAGKGLSRTSNIRLNYKHTFATNHEVDGFIAYEENRTVNDNVRAQRIAFATPYLEQIDAGSTDRANGVTAGTGSITARQNYFGRAGYSYAGKYNAQFQFRYDGSQNFPKESRFGFFPGFSVGWNIARENFMQGIEILDYLKVRASYGQLGNDNVPAYQYLTLYSSGTGPLFGGAQSQTLSRTRLPNPNIHWEVAKTLDIGTEFGLFKGLLTAEVDYFHTRRENILAQRSTSVPSYTGLVLPSENIGIVENAGFEFTLGNTTRVSKDLTLSLSTNLTYAKSTIIYQDELSTIPQWQKFEGTPVTSSGLVYEVIGIYRDAADIAANPSRPGTQPGDLKLRDTDGNGTITTNDQVRQRVSNIPRIVYGISPRIQYKNFDLTLLFSGQAKVIVELPNVAYNPLTDNGLISFTKNDWTPENPDGTGIRVASTLGFGGTDYMRKNAAFLMLRTAQFGYTLPSSLTQKAGINVANFYVSGSNLFYLMDHLKEYGLDPETTGASGLQPQDRIVSVGVNLTF
jgi:TonB-linked SusC/RagA family outer membrane protein